MKNQEQTTPGDGIRSLKTSRVFRIINFELYSKPNKVIMAFGLVSMTFTVGYLVYMRHQYEQMGYYPAVAEDGRHEIYKPKQSKWE
ncbi:small integral membrane protein 8 [Adelges cooleyi]|uniref:small integral membrane protein 8 n=1 Tax=Adelges cooleyi TaxID=133065 RepID=UPI00217FB581|nr:small integral membrane protein 8 [Adelges cooleyi]